jgi:hypothetical protein
MPGAYHTATKLDVQVMLIEAARVLKTAGFVLDVCHHPLAGQLMKDFKSFKKYWAEMDSLTTASADDYFNGASWFEVQWRTLVANKSLQGTMAPDDFAQQYRQLRHDLGNAAELDEESAIRFRDMTMSSLWMQTSLHSSTATPSPKPNAVM